jgi:ribosomal-protein-alanine N-acetyltransferase
MVPDDLEEAGALESRVYSQPWPHNVFDEELAQPSRRYLAVTVGGALAGYGGVMLVDEEAHVTTVVVDPERRNVGIGRRLMVELVDAALAGGARSLTLEVRASNTAAQALYRRFGMAPVGVRKQYYRDEDALIMWVHDIDSPEYARRLAEIRSDDS